MTYIVRSQCSEPHYASQYLGWRGGALLPVIDLRYAERFCHLHMAQEAAARYNRQQRVAGAPAASFIVVECE